METVWAAMSAVIGLKHALVPHQVNLRASCRHAGAEQVVFIFFIFFDEVRLAMKIELKKNEDDCGGYVDEDTV